MATLPSAGNQPYGAKVLAFISQVAGFDPASYGAIGGGNDDTTAVLAARAAARAVNGFVKCSQMYTINQTFIQDSSFGIDGCAGLGGLRAGSSMPAGAPVLWTEVTGSTPSTSITQSHLFGWWVHDLRLEGNSRSVACKGWKCDLVTAGNVRNVQIRHFAQEGFLAGTSARETEFGGIHVRGCGDLANGYPAVSLAQSTSADAHNNLIFSGLKSIYPFGIGLSVLCTDDTSPTRGITFDNCMFHGFTPATPVTDEGEVLTPDWRCVGAPMVQVGDAQTIVFKNSRFHRSGYGQPLVLVRDNPNSASSKNVVTLTDCSYGLPEHQTGNFTAVAATDLCTFTGGQLGTGAMVRFTTTGTLPAGLSLLTDYYTIRVDDNTFKVATTRANAEAGTNVDITSAGTGTHTVTTQDFFVLVEHSSGQTDVVMRGGHATEDCSTVRAAVCNKAADGVVQVSGFSPASTLAAIYEPFSPTDNPNIEPLNAVASAAAQTGFASDTYVAGSGVVVQPSRLRAGMSYRFRCDLQKTAAGTAVAVATVRMGTAGSTSDAAILTFTFPSAQTAAGDNAQLEILVNFRSIGAGVLAVAAGTMFLSHTNSATGFLSSGVFMPPVRVTSSGFDSTAITDIGVSLNGGTSAAWTITTAQADLA